MTAALLAGLACALLTAVNLASIAIAFGRLRRRVRLAVSHRDPVTIVRPVCGLEPFVEETLASGFALDHPAFELVFCVESATDPVIPVVERLMAARPDVEARLLIGEDRISGNPKLNNCVKGWEAARHDWIVLADSNVLMPPDYLEQLLSRWQDDTGLVCSTPVGTRPEGFWAELECAFLNSHQARWQYVGEAVGLGFAQGKTMLWRRDFLDAHGGIRALGAEIAEDAASTKLVRAEGLHVHLVHSPFEQPLGRRSVRQVWDRQVRWARLRRVTFPIFFTPEIFSGAAVALLLGLIAAGTAGVSIPLTAALLLALWYGPEAALARAKGWPLSRRLVAGFLARDALIPAVWLFGWTTGITVWRGNSVPFDGEVSRPVAHPSPLVASSARVTDRG